MPKKKGRHRISKHFYLDEYTCRCKRPECGAPKYPKSFFVDLIEAVRKECNFPFFVNSWVRCPFWNRAVGGASDSIHMTGYAIDIGCTNSKRRAKLIHALLKRGFSVIVYSNFIHADLGRPEQILLRGKK